MHQVGLKMAAQGDFLCGDDLDALLAAIDADILESDAAFESGINSTVEEIPKESDKIVYNCSLCTKVCLSKQGLSRHTNAKHKAGQTSQANKNTPDAEKKAAEKILHPLTSKSILKNVLQS